MTRVMDSIGLNIFFSVIIFLSQIETYKIENQPNTEVTK